MFSKKPIEPKTKQKSINIEEDMKPRDLNTTKQKSLKNEENKVINLT